MKKTLKNIISIPLIFSAVYLFACFEYKTFKPKVMFQKIIEEYYKVQQDKKIKEEGEAIKDSVFKYVDENHDGKLSRKEKCNRDYLMEIEDSSDIYYPTQKDWERAYKTIKEVKSIDNKFIKEQIESHKE